MDKLLKVPEALYRYRRAVQVLAIVEVILVVLVLILLGLGLYLNTCYALLLIFEAPHLFSWMASLGVSADMQHIPFILMTVVLYVITLIADFISVVWRLVILVQCETEQNCDTFLLIFSWITFGGVGLMMILDCVFIALNVGIIAQLRIYADDLMKIFLNIQKHIGPQLNAGGIK